MGFHDWENSRSALLLSVRSNPALGRLIADGWLIWTQELWGNAAGRSECLGCRFGARLCYPLKQNKFMNHGRFLLILLAVFFVGSLSANAAGVVDLKQQVIETERAFARTMADRDFAAFSSFISAEAVFFSSEKPLRGKEEVVGWWKRFFEKPEAPFSWEPESVEVLDSGTLALSTGPVHDAKGKFTGTFTSVWRLEAPGKWRIVFDKGNPVREKP